jgi:Methyltransferase FkbM domain
MRPTSAPPAWHTCIAGGVADSHDSPTYLRASEIVVETRTLDSVVSAFELRPPDALIDVEGAEALVLRGAREMLRRHRPTIFCELHNIDSAVDVACELLPIGYRPRLLFRQKRTLCNYLWVPSHEC